MKGFRCIKALYKLKYIVSASVHNGHYTVEPPELKFGMENRIDTCEIIGCCIPHQQDLGVLKTGSWGLHSPYSKLHKTKFEEYPLSDN